MVEFRGVSERDLKRLVDEVEHEEQGARTEEQDTASDVVQGAVNPFRREPVLLVRDVQPRKMARLQGAVHQHEHQHENAGNDKVPEEKDRFRPPCVGIAGKSEMGGDLAGQNEVVVDGVTHEQGTEQRKKREGHRVVVLFRRHRGFVFAG